MITLDGIALPPGLVWTDEFKDAGVTQTIKRTLDGSLVVFYGGQNFGRPITLASQPDSGWWTRAQIEAVQIRAASPGGVFLLRIGASNFTVMFRHHDAPAFEAEALIPRLNPAPGDFYLATLKLMTV